jgi:hypothetical protein
MNKLTLESKSVKMMQLIKIIEFRSNLESKFGFENLIDFKQQILTTKIKIDCYLK